VVANALGSDLEVLHPVSGVVSDPTSRHGFRFARPKRRYYSSVPYIAVMDDHEPAALWHDGPANHQIAETPGQGGPWHRTAVPLPSFAEIGAVVIFDANQFGFPPTELRIRLLDEAGEVARKDIAGLYSPRSLLSLDELFAEERKNLGDAHAVVECRFSPAKGREPTLMAAIHYHRGGRWLDQGHTTVTISSHAPYGQGGHSFRCRKFAPLMTRSGTDSLFSIQNLTPTGECPETTYRLRVFTDDGEEFVQPLRLAANTAAFVRGKDLLPQDGRDRSGVVWVEHPSVNAACHWFLFDRKARTMAADHFTGG
jgi:hypothetical protein